MNIDTFLNINGADELLQKVFSFLDAQTLAKCRLVNRRFNANAQERKLYSVEENKLQDAFKEYVTAKLKRAIEPLDLDHELERLRQARQRAEHASSHTWLGWFVSQINTPTGILSTIRGLLERIFPAIRNELAHQNKLFNEIQDLKARASHARQRINELDSELDKTHTEYVRLKHSYIFKNIPPWRDVLEQLQDRPEPVRTEQALPRIVRLQDAIPQRPQASKPREHKIEYRWIHVPGILRLRGKLMPFVQPQSVRVPWCTVCDKSHG
jgi:hypothetical protein